jgi:hypothetical protein
MHSIRFCLFILIAVSAWEQKTFCQTNGSAATDAERANRSKLISSINAEQKRGAVLSYTQQYRSNGKSVIYKRTLYLAISSR